MPEDVQERAGVDIRRMDIGDTETVTRIRLDAFDRSFLSSLGSTTIRLYYEATKGRPMLEFHRPLGSN